MSPAQMDVWTGEKNLCRTNTDVRTFKRNPAPNTDVNTCQRRWKVSNRFAMRFLVAECVRTAIDRVRLSSFLIWLLISNSYFNKQTELSTRTRCLILDNVYNIVYNLLLIYLLFTNLESFRQSFIIHLAGGAIFSVFGERKEGIFLSNNNVAYHARFERNSAQNIVVFVSTILTNLHQTCHTRILIQQVLSA